MTLYGVMNPQLSGFLFGQLCGLISHLHTYAELPEEEDRIQLACHASVSKIFGITLTEVLAFSQRETKWVVISENLRNTEELT